MRMNVKKHVYSVSSIGVFLFAPMVAFAQTPVDGLITSVKGWVTLATPIVVGIGLLAFFWGLVKYIYNADSEDAKENGRRIMIWGVVALFVMVSVWGLVAFVSDALIGDSGTQPFGSPCINKLC